MAFTTEEAYWAAVRSDLKSFLQQAFSTIYPRDEYLDNWHIDAIVYCLEQSIQGRMPRLIINLPPRHLKSFIASVALPAFILGMDPSAKIVCISYSDELTKKLSLDFKRLVESEGYRMLYPHVRPTKKTEGEFVTDQGGSRLATSVYGTLTGRGGDFIIIDDPIKAADALSDKLRESTNEWFNNTLFSRLDDKQRSVLILVMQRLHVNDLTGFVESGGGFHKLSLPAIAIRDERIPVNGTETYLRREGEPLHAEREGIDTLKGIRDLMGPFNFASQYQQRPETPEGVLIKRKYINVIDPPHHLATGGYSWVSIDSALSISETADYSAISLGHSNRDGHYVYGAERGRWDYETLRAKALAYTRRYRDLTFIVEAAGSGISLIQYLMQSRQRCFSYRPKHDKQARAAVVLPIFLDGRVIIVNKQGENSWVEPYINELVSFPHGRFDDQVDSLVQALNWAELRVNPRGQVYYVG